MFTHLNEFKGCYQPSHQEEIKSRYTQEFQKAVSEGGKGEGEVFFVDIQDTDAEVILY